MRLSGSMLALSAFLPWARIWFVEVTGLQWGVGWIVLPTGAVSAAMSGISLTHERAVHGLRAAQFASAVAGIVAFAIAYSAISDACNEMERSWLSTGDSGSCVGSFMGIGAVVSLFAGSALGLVALFRRPTQEIS